MNSDEPRTDTPRYLRETAAGAVREALRRVDERVDAMTDDHVASQLAALLDGAGIKRRDAVDTVELDLVRFMWEAEFATASAGVRGGGTHGTVARFELSDEAFELLQGTTRKDYDPPVKVTVVSDETHNTITVNVVVAGRVVDDVHHVAVLVRTSAMGTIEVPVTIDRTDAVLTGVAQLTGEAGEILKPAVIAEVGRRDR